MQRSNLTPIFVILAIFVVLMSASAAWGVVPEKVVLSLNGTSGNEVAGLSIDAAGNLWVLAALAAPERASSAVEPCSS